MLKLHLWQGLDPAGELTTLLDPLTGLRELLHGRGGVQMGRKTGDGRGKEGRVREFVGRYWMGRQEASRQQGGGRMAWKK